MKKILYLFNCIVFLFISNITFAQSADEIISKYLDALGGKEKLLAIHSIVSTGSQNYYGTYESIVLTEVNDSLLRYDIEAYGKKGYWVLTKNEGGEYFPWEKGEKKLFSKHEVNMQQGALNIHNPLLTYQKDSATADFIGIRKLDSIPYYFLSVNYKNGKRMYYWFDTSNFLLKQTQNYYRVITSQNDKLNSYDITRYAGWREVDGILFPFVKTTDVYVNKVKAAQKMFLLYRHKN